MVSLQHRIHSRRSSSSVRSKRRLSPLLGSITLLAISLGATRALAEPSAADRATARALANEAHEALVKQDFNTAEDRFRRADALVHAPTLVVAHARALVGLGRRAAAFRRYESVVREGVKPNAPWSWKQALKEAESELEKLRPTLAWLNVRVQPDDAEVMVNQEPVPNAELGTVRAVDPGPSVVRAMAPGFLENEIRVEAAVGSTQEVAIALVKREVPTEAVVLAEPPPPRPVPSAPIPKRPDRTLAYVAFGVGAAGLATGITTGVIALGQKSDLEDQCRRFDCRNPPLGSDARVAQLNADKSRYHLFGVLSGVGFGVGLAGAAAGLYLWFTNAEPATPTGRFVQPYVGLGSAGLTGSF